MAREAVVQAEMPEDDRHRDAALRPRWLREVIGQKAVVQRLGIVLKACKKLKGETNLDLRALTASAEAFAAPGIIVRTRNSDLFRWCVENGLRVVEPMEETPSQRDHASLAG